MKLIDVHVRLAQGMIRVGKLAFTDPDQQGHYESEFRYDPHWLTHPLAYPLDPKHLPLTPGIFRADRLTPPLGVFADALPDDWGRNLLSRHLPRNQRAEPFLFLAMSGNGLGALVFSDSEHPARPQSAAPAMIVHLPDLLAAADAFEANLPIEDALLERLMAAGGTPGGARPKAIVQDERGQWLAKFPSRTRDGSFDVVGLEAACMTAARKSGIDVPDIDLINVGAKRVLLVRRFDVNTSDNGRVHMISMRSLYGERPGHLAGTYQDLADTLRQCSSDPAKDIHDLYRRMIFNAAIGNTDDHLKNLWMLGGPDGFRLSPGFDLTPDVNRNNQHTLAFLYHYTCPSRGDALELGNRWGIKNTDTIIDDVINAVSKFKTIAESLGVKKEDVAFFGADIERRLMKLRKQSDPSLGLIESTPVDPPRNLKP